MKKKVLPWIGIGISAAMIICGIILWTSTTGATNYIRCSDASFGADFYTYIYGVAVQIADNTATTASGAHDIFYLLAEAFGMMFILGGLLSGLHFVKELPEKEKKAEQPSCAAPVYMPADAMNVMPAESMNVMPAPEVPQDDANMQ